MSWLIDRDRFNRPTGISNVPRPTVTLDLARRIEDQPPDGGARENLIAERRRALARLGEQQENEDTMNSVLSVMQQRLAELNDVSAGLSEAASFKQAAIESVEQGQTAYELGNRMGEATANKNAQFRIATLVDQFKPETPSANFLQRAIWSRNTDDSNFYEYARELEGIQRFREFKNQMDILDEAGEQRLVPLAAGFSKEGVRPSEFQTAVNSLRKGDLTAISEIPIERQEAYNRLLRSITPARPSTPEDLNFEALDDNQPENFFPETKVSPKQTREIGEAFVDSSVRFEDFEKAFEESRIESPARGRVIPPQELVARQRPVRNLLKDAQTFKQEQGDKFVGEAVLGGTDPSELQYIVDVADRVNMTPKQFQQMPELYRRSTIKLFNQEQQDAAEKKDRRKILGMEAPGALGDVAEVYTLFFEPQNEILDNLFATEQEIFASRTRPKINALLEAANIPFHETIAKYIAEFAVPTSAIGFVGKAPKAASIAKRVTSRIGKFGFQEGVVNVKQDEMGRLERGEAPQTPEEAALIFLAGAGASGVAPEVFSVFGRTASTVANRAAKAGRAVPIISEIFDRVNIARESLSLPRFDFASDPEIIRVLDDAGVETEIRTTTRSAPAVRDAVVESPPSTASVELGGRGRIAADIPNQELGEQLLVEPVLTTSGKLQSAASADIGSFVARKNSPKVVFGRIVAKTKRGAVVVDNGGKRHTVPYRQLQPVTQTVLEAEPNIQKVGQIAGVEGGGRAVGFDVTQPGGVRPSRLPAVIDGEAPQAPLTRGVTGEDPAVARRLLQDVTNKELPDVPIRSQRLLPERAVSLEVADQTPTDGVTFSKRTGVGGPLTGETNNVEVMFAKNRLDTDVENGVLMHIVSKGNNRNKTLTDARKIINQFMIDNQGVSVRGNVTNPKLADALRSAGIKELLEPGFGDTIGVRGTPGKFDFNPDAQTSVTRTTPSDAGPARDLLTDVGGEAFDESLPTIKGTNLEALEEVSDMLESGVSTEARVNVSVDNGPVEEMSLVEAVDLLAPRTELDALPNADVIVERSVDARAKRLEEGIKAGSITEGGKIDIHVDDTIPTDIPGFSGFLSSDGKMISSQFTRDTGTGTEIHEELIQQLGYNHRKPSIRSKNAGDDGLLRVSKPGNRLWGMDGQNWDDVQRVAKALRDSGFDNNTELGYDIIDGAPGLPGRGALPKPNNNTGQAKIGDILGHKTTSVEVPAADTVVDELSDVVGRASKPNEGKLVKADDGEVFTSKDLETKACR